MTRRKTDKPSGRTAPPAPKRFEDALQRLEAIVAKLEQGEAPLDTTLTLYEEGVGLARFCQNKLRDAERKVELLEDKQGSIRGRPFPGEEAVSDAGDDGKDEAGYGAPDDDEEDTDADDDADGPDEEADPAAEGRDTLF